MFSSLLLFQIIYLSIFVTNCTITLNDCNINLIENNSVSTNVIDRIITNSISLIIGTNNATVPSINTLNYWLVESPLAKSTVLTIGSNVNDRFWLTGISIQQDPGMSNASVYNCKTGNDLDDPLLFLVEYSFNGDWYVLDSANGPLGLYSFDELLANENAIIRVAMPNVQFDSIRISKYYESPSRFCMRYEVHGCHSNDGLISPDVIQYNMEIPNGRSSNGYDFTDNKYTGICQNGACTGGVGLLTDGVIETATHLNYGEFTGWLGSASYPITLYLREAYQIDEIIFYGSSLLAIPTNSRSPTHITVNGIRYEVKDFPLNSNQINFNYIGLLVYSVVFPYKEVVNRLDIILETVSNYNLLLSEISVIVKNSDGANVILARQVLYPNGTIISFPSILTPTTNTTIPTPTTNTTIPTPTTNITLPSLTINTTIPTNNTTIPTTTTTNTTIPSTITAFQNGTNILLTTNNSIQNRSPTLLPNITTTKLNSSSTLNNNSSITITTTDMTIPQLQSNIFSLNLIVIVLAILLALVILICSTTLFIISCLLAKNLHKNHLKPKNDQIRHLNVPEVSINPNYPTTNPFTYEGEINNAALNYESISLEIYNNDNQSKNSQLPESGNQQYSGLQDPYNKLREDISNGNTNMNSYHSYSELPLEKNPYNRIQRTDCK